MSGIAAEGTDLQAIASMRQKLTLVIHSQGRATALRRALQYYGAWQCSILVLDSSASAAADIELDFPSVAYRHLSDSRGFELEDFLCQGIAQVQTPYVAFTAASDFLFQPALDQSLAFLEQHADYGLCHGYSLSYRNTRDQTHYYRRDKKVCENYGSDNVQERVLSKMEHYITLTNAVTRTGLLRDWSRLISTGTGMEWQEIGYAFYLLARAKARILPVAYALYEVIEEQKSDLYKALTAADSASQMARAQYGTWLASVAAQLIDLDSDNLEDFVSRSFVALAECLRSGNSLTLEPIVESTWSISLELPVRRFGPNQYVEMPFYNQPFFDELTAIEFLAHALPAGLSQLKDLEGAWVEQTELLAGHDNDTPETIQDRLRLALGVSLFNRTVVQRLADSLDVDKEQEEIARLRDWLQRLDAVGTEDRHSLLQTTASGHLLNWLEARQPRAEDIAAIAAHLSAHKRAPQFCLLLLDLDNNLDHLQITLDSLVEGKYQGFKVVIFTTGTPWTATTPKSLLHFVKVTRSNYVEKLNLAVSQSSCDWVMLCEVGDQFTTSGLLVAALELLNAPQCRAVAVDEIQREEGGALVDVFRPGFNLDMLQRLPALMARHWLVRRDVLLDAGGYNADYGQALEFDLLLRLIETGGMAWLAHLDEPLLICQAAKLQVNHDEQMTLNRHLSVLGYAAHVSARHPGVYQIDYRHTERPMVSVLLEACEDPAAIKRCLTNTLLKTRYMRYEVIVADNASLSEEMRAWLDTLARQGGRVRVIRSEQRLTSAALYNWAGQQAKGEYLVLLANDSEVVNPNWIEALLNQAQRPEVGVVGAKLIDRQGCVTQAGLVLGLNGGVASAFVGEPKDAQGYMHRLEVEQSLAAVSGVCLMVRKSLFDAVGGLDEDDFAHAWSDVDLCLKIGQQGYMTVWTPQVHVIHPGNLPQAPEALAALREKWAGAFAHDQAYNKNLALTGKGFTLDRDNRLDWAQLLA
jgi:glycosyltransferase domain-containing protein